MLYEVITGSGRASGSFIDEEELVFSIAAKAGGSGVQKEKRMATLATREGRAVITSYSIHYTKLYETLTASKWYSGSMMTGRKPPCFLRLSAVSVGLNTTEV